MDEKKQENTKIEEKEEKNETNWSSEQVKEFKKMPDIRTSSNEKLNFISLIKKSETNWSSEHNDVAENKEKETENKEATENKEKLAEINITEDYEDSVKNIMNQEWLINLKLSERDRKLSEILVKDFLAKGAKKQYINKMLLFDLCGINQ